LNSGTKDTHINFGECLDEVDWNEADVHTKKADLCIIAGTSMSLRHITHFPFQAKKVCYS
jgi:NAD-dependent SIR2 family protein deacetylase